MSKIVISYRRDDTAGYAGRLYDRLNQHFGDGQIFMDIDRIDPGEDFVEIINQNLAVCSALVVVIGRNWLNATDEQGARRLENPDDFVRIEITAALERKVRVIPVLVGGANMPATRELPQALTALARLQALEIGDTRFHQDVLRLIAAAEKALAARLREDPAPPATAATSTEGLTHSGSGVAPATTKVGLSHVEAGTSAKPAASRVANVEAKAETHGPRAEIVRQLAPLPNIEKDQSEPAGPSRINALLAAADPVLDIVSHLRETSKHPKPSKLRDELAQAIRDFEGRARSLNASSKAVAAARLALCALLDEVAASTPWGKRAEWTRKGLLNVFEGRTDGGERFFRILDELSASPDENVDLLELFYVCLTFGFEGHYRFLDNGRALLDEIGRQLLGRLHCYRPSHGRELSPGWQAAALKRPVLAVLPLWVMFALCGLALLAAYLGFRYFLNAESDPLFAKIHAIRVGVVAPKPPPPPPEVPRPRLAPLLANEIAKNLVAVDDQDARSVVTILGDRLFAPGSASVSPDLEPVIRSIAEALDAVPGQVVVTVHTDNQAIGSVRFRSNWHLSEERARSVVQLLAQKIAPPSRLTAEGAGDTTPIASNETPEGRARNRRVEIVLTFAPPRK